GRHVSTRGDRLDARLSAGAAGSAQTDAKIFLDFGQARGRSSSAGTDYPARHPRRDRELAVDLLSSARSARRNAMSHRRVLGPATVILSLVVILACGVMVPRVDAGIGGSSTIVMPGTVVVGVTFNASMIIRNQSTPPNDTESVKVISAFITPSCAGPGLGICVTPNLDPGVFDILSAAGDPNTASCAGVSFPIGPPK